MKIVVAVRCLNEIKHVDRFMRGYGFSDTIVVSDGGSTDGSVEAIKKYDNVELIHFGEKTTIDGYEFNEDAPHMNFVLDYAKSLNPDWLIFDDFDCVPNHVLRDSARDVLEKCAADQVNVFRLYFWGDDQYFPLMNSYFDINYTSLWAWRPNKVNIYADPSIKHGTLVGLSGNFLQLPTPTCLLHKSWNPATVNDKIKRYAAHGLAMNHPLSFAGVPAPLPEWAKED